MSPPGRSHHKRYLFCEDEINSHIVILVLDFFFFFFLPSEFTIHLQLIHNHHHGA